MAKQLTQSEFENPCIDCYYARMRTDICGIYCIGSFWKEPDGSCSHWVWDESKPNKEER